MNRSHRARDIFTLAVVLLIPLGCSRVSTSAHLTTLAHPWTVHGVLRLGDDQVPDNLNRMLGTVTIDSELANLWCAHLFIFDDHERLLPELATVEPTLHNGGISSDGRTIVYHLRRHVLWHDGVPFAARDVAFSWQQVMNPNNIIQSRTDYDMVDRIDTPDDLTAVVQLRYPYAPFVSTFFTSYCLLPEHALAGRREINDADYNRHPIGTGAFMVSEYQPGTLIRFVANPRYWRGPPQLHEIEFRVVPSQTTLLTQLRTHELDFYHDASAEQAPQLGTVAGTTVYRYPFSTFNDIGFNSEHAVVADKRVRQALAYATDVPAIIRLATHGVFIPADGDQPPWRWSHAANISHYVHDPVRAAKLLDAAGWRLGADRVRHRGNESLHLDLVGQAGNQVTAAAELLLQQQWRHVGVDVALHNYPNNVLYALGSGIEQSGKFDVIFEGWTESADPDQYQLYACDMRPPAGWNVYGYCNPALDAAERIARRSFDPLVRKQAYARIQQIVTDDLPFYVLWFQQNQDATNSDLQGYRPGRTASAFWNVWQWSI